MRRSKAEIYLHFVWTTYRRLPLIGSGLEREVYACILREARRLDCKVLAIGGMPDHVHLAVDLPPKLAPARLMQQLKGVSSAFGRDQLPAGELFGWQDGYGVYSFSRSHLTKASPTSSGRRSITSRETPGMHGSKQEKMSNGSSPMPSQFPSVRTVAVPCRVVYRPGREADAAP